MSVRLYEFEGKELFKEMNIPVLENAVVNTVDEAVQAAASLGYPVVVKAQVLRGGRGKAGLVKLAADPAELKKIAGDILAKIAATECLMLEKAFSSNQEAYIGITVDDLQGRPIIVLSGSGGVDVEAAAKSGQSNMVWQLIDPVKGLYQHQVLGLAKKAGFSGAMAVKVAELGVKLYKTFQQFDCDVAEINPVMINTETQELIAGDAKVIIDDYALSRQPVVKKFKREKSLTDSGIFFVDLGGSIGLVSGGASVTMMVCDSIKVMGGEPGNFLDSVGGSTVESIAEKARVVIQEANRNPRYKVILLNYGIAALSLKTVVDGICLALSDTPSRVPIVASIRATSASLLAMSLAEAKEILQSKGVDFRPTLLDAIENVITISKR